MKKIKIVVVLLLAMLAFPTGCSKKEENNKTIKYDHYLRGGGKEVLDATILWEYSNSTYTKYQVAYTSYVCSDPSVNYKNVIYVEITNRDTKEASLIRNISFSTINEGETVFNVGLWGDYKSVGEKDFYSGIEAELINKLKYSKYEDIKKISDKGYGNYKHIEGLNSDLITSGTISATNLITILKAIFDYHIENYY